MRDLPVEILIKVFDHLPRSDKLQCAVVCKAWCTSALSILNSTIHLKTASDTVILFEKLCQLNSSIRGSTIRHLSVYHSSRISEARVNKVVFIRILSECTHLRTLEFKDVTLDLTYLEHMIRYRNVLRLDHLQCIKTQYSNSSSYLLANWHYHQRINQLYLLILDSTFSQFEQANDLSMYLGHFKALKTLSLRLSCNIYIHSVLSACPQLESLQLMFISASQLRIYEDDKKSATRHSNIPFQLKYLDISGRQINQDLFEYLHDRAGALFQLTVNHNAYGNLEAIDSAFNTALVVDTVLPIRRIILEDNFDISHDVIIGLNENFRNLRVIDFRRCNFNRVMDRNSNLSLNLIQLDLDYLSIDFTTILFYNRQVNSMSVAIQRNDYEGTTFYSRTSKWSAAHLFTRNDSSRYTNNAAQRIRVRSAKTSVITIKVRSLHQLHMHAEGNRKTFSQIISLNY
ncbi:hypothetical protein V8B55DRAFT_1440035 [Mucor lusitanicus]|uniref:F-box domain-containing protein n=2 Tax=Mucor circinelloides f. lusitanicus TaxID=29924 RepID=A0A168NAH7_MUCCL|nr:hypothetical protein FB192DRAFT_1460066 [Mucor lusitanicus]OAD06019.1 hypothetical protein MUCCIDRAFT_159712 [Mucor lusitanicus CBS 277.49]